MSKEKLAGAERNVFLYKLLSLVQFLPFMLPVIVLFWQENGLDMFDVYILQGVFALFIVLLEVPTGMVADRIGKKTSLLWGLGVLLGLYPHSCQVLHRQGASGGVADASAKF